MPTEPKELPPPRVTQVVTRPDNSVAVRVRQARIEVVEGPDQGQQIELGHRGALIGAAASCDLVLTDGAVSNHHFELRPSEAGFVLRDLDSKNGTRLGRTQVQRALLTHSEEIRIGRTLLRLQLLDGHDELPLSRESSFGQLLGRSVAMRQVFFTLERIAQLDATVLLQGESGTGKELAARAIHDHSPRRGQPLVVVDCGAVQANLIESELFGHVRGAFSGADRDREGAFEAAHGGTVLLDEIGELDPSLQPRLLRLLESREVKRLGENHHRAVDVRLLAATHHDLRSEVDTGHFREDLFYRLSVVRVRLPPLRERRADIPLLARSFVARLRPDVDVDMALTPAVLAMLRSHNWPGNVRELRNEIERLLIFPEQQRSDRQATTTPGAEVPADLLQLPFREAREQWLDRFERAYLLAALDAEGDVVVRAAKRAEVPRQTFYRLLGKHGLIKG